MKSTYKLFGTFWDGITSTDSYRIELNNTFPEEGTYQNISFKELLMVENEQEFFSLTNSLTKTDSVILTIDYWNKSNQIVESFLEKRLSQAVTLLESKAESVMCVYT